MHKLYSMCILSVLSIGYIHNAKAYPTGVQCGITSSQRRKPRILNGTVAEVNQFPWIASIKRNGVHVCGGSIIAGHFILSAAHCFQEFQNYDWSVTLGEYNQAENETFSATYYIKSVISHENYCLHNRLIQNDIAILELTEYIQWSPYIRPICLPEVNTQSESDAIAAGWGPDDLSLHATDEGNAKLRYVKIDIFDNDRCNEIYQNKSIPIVLEKTHMCAGRLDEIRDTNNGDSGGLLQILVNQRQVLVGITSVGIGDSYFPKPPGIYVRVFLYMDWIMEHIHEVLYYPPVLSNKSD